MVAAAAAAPVAGGLWALLGRLGIGALGGAARNPIKTTAAAGLVDHFAFDGAGRSAIFGGLTPDILKDPQKLMDKFLELIQGANLGGLVGGGLGLVVGEGMVGRAVCALALGLVCNAIYSRYLQSHFDAARAPVESLSLNRDITTTQERSVSTESELNLDQK